VIDFRELAQPMRLSFTRWQYVADRNTSRQKCIRYQLSVTLPPNGFRAHDHRRVPLCKLEKTVERLLKRGRLHVIRVPAKAGMAPGGIRRIASRFSQSAKRWKMAVSDPPRAKRRLERGAVELRVAG
jgi:hypothetical protein